MTSDSIVTVIMPVYNTEKFVPMSIDSILNQTYTQFEFVIIDDGSKDSSWQIVQTYAEQDSRIVALQNEENLGIVQTLNRGLSIANGKYIVRMDADDISPLDRLEKQVAYMEQNPTVGVLGTNITYIDEDDQPYHQGKLKHELEESVSFIQWSLLWRCAIYHPTVMIRKSILDETGYLYKENFKYAEDYDLWTRMMHHTEIARLHDTIVQMRILSTSISRQHNQVQMNLTIQIRKREIEKYLNTSLSPSGLDTLCKAFSYDVIPNGDFLGAADILFLLYQQFLETNPASTHSEVLDDVIKREVRLAYVAANSGERWTSLKLFGLTARFSVKGLLSKHTLIFAWKSISSVFRTDANLKQS